MYQNVKPLIYFAEGWSINMKIIGVIPARYESSRFPGKPLADICGKPMIWWVYQQCKKVKDFEGNIYVATDSEKIMEVCKELSIKAIMTSNTHRTGTDRVGEVAQLEQLLNLFIIILIYKFLI